MFFNNSTSPGYEITYIIVVLGYTGCGMILLVLDSLFLQMCLYIIAGFQDLQHMIYNLDGWNVAVDDKNKKCLKSNDLMFISNIKICFQFHNWLLRYAIRNYIYINN